MDGASAPITVSVPYVVGDHEGELTDALVYALSRTANFRYKEWGGQWVLKAKIKETDNDRIGYKYDRDPKSGILRKNIMGVENRKSIAVEVCIEDSATGALVLGPQLIKADAHYDYFDPDSLRDLSFTEPSTGKTATSVAFSLGQLDSVGAAGENAIYPIYQKLARKIVDGMIGSGGEYVD